MASSPQRSLESFVRELILPTLTAVGRGWEQGSFEISQEHFASNLIRGRLLSLARLWGRGSVGLPPVSPISRQLLCSWDVPL